MEKDNTLFCVTSHIQRDNVQQELDYLDQINKYTQEERDKTRAFFKIKGVDPSSVKLVEGGFKITKNCPTSFDIMKEYWKYANKHDITMDQEYISYLAHVYSDKFTILPYSNSQIESLTMTQQHNIKYSDRLI